MIRFTSQQCSIMEKLLFLLLGCFIFCSSFLLTSANAGDTTWMKTGGDLLKNVVTDIGAGDEGISNQPTLGQMAGAFKEALQMGSESVVNQLGGHDGFNKDAAVHIPLPAQLESVKTMLATVGMSQIVDDLELKLNRAAEAATPRAKALFVQAITDMTFDDVKKIYEGPKDSATNYFRDKMGHLLSSEMRPIVDDTLSQVGAVQSYDQVISNYKAIPFVPDVKADLIDHVLEKGMDGIFYYIAKEEAAIRENPAKHTTDLLKQVFGK